MPKILIFFAILISTFSLSAETIEICVQPATSFGGNRTVSIFQLEKNEKNGTYNLVEFLSNKTGSKRIEMMTDLVCEFQEFKKAIPEDFMYILEGNYSFKMEEAYPYLAHCKYDGKKDPTNSSLYYTVTLETRFFLGGGPTVGVYGSDRDYSLAEPSMKMVVKSESLGKNIDYLGGTPMKLDKEYQCVPTLDREGSLTRRSHSYF